MSNQKVAIIGKGMIGISLAVLFTGNGIPTIVLAKNSAAGLEKYRTYYRDLIAQGLVTEQQAAACEKHLSFTESYSDLVNVEIVLECVTEKLEVKYEVYRQIEANCPHLKAIASTTSAISPVDLARGVSQREKIMVAHPYNPPHLVPCVELVKNDFTSQEALDAVVDLLEYCGREVCKMNKAAPGFIANRLQHALYREAVYMVEQGICAPEDIDKCIRSSWGPAILLLACSIISTMRVWTSSPILKLISTPICAILRRCTHLFRSGWTGEIWGIKQVLVIMIGGSGIWTLSGKRPVRHICNSLIGNFPTNKRFHTKNEQVQYL